MNIYTPEDFNKSYISSFPLELQNYIYKFVYDECISEIKKNITHTIVNREPVSFSCYSWGEIDYIYNHMGYRHYNEYSVIKYSNVGIRVIYSKNAYAELYYDDDECENIKTMDIWDFVHGTSEFKKICKETVSSVHTFSLLSHDRKVKILIENGIVSRTRYGLTMASHGKLIKQFMSLD